MEPAYRYSRFCELYRQWRGRQKRSMHQRHLAGEKLFIDYCGPTMLLMARLGKFVRRRSLWRSRAPRTIGYLESGIGRLGCKLPVRVDKNSFHEPTAEHEPVAHENLRGPGYYR